MAPITTICSLLLFLLLTRFSSSSSPPPNSFVLRLRFPDGSVEKVGLVETTNDASTLNDVLTRIPKAQGLQAHIGNRLADATQTIEALGLRHGSLLTLTDPQKKKAATTGLQPSRKSASRSRQNSNRWDPFPDLAKNYDAARRATRRKKGALSYGDLARLQAELHTVEAQPSGSVQRVYMCRQSAEALAVKTGKGKTTTASLLLLGTVQRERKDRQGRKKARTSLSSTTADQDMVTAAKVQAVWQPPVGSDHVLTDYYNNQQLLRVRQVATWLGLQPIGWIFTYDVEPNRHADDGLPVWGSDVQQAATLQIHNMQHIGRTDGAQFVTLAMDGSTGATEAFQLSDVAVQMTAEGVWKALVSASSSKQRNNARIMETNTPVVVDGKESHTVDSVLCLVNTALLGHDGLYADGHPSAVKKTGGLTKKVKKQIREALSANNNDGALLQVLCNFSLLVSLTERLTPTEAETLVTTVRKYARGQKKSTQLDASLKQKIGSFVES